MTPSRVALRAVQTEELLRSGSGGFWQLWQCREGLRAPRFGVRMASLGRFAPQQPHPKLFPQCGQPGSCLNWEQMMLGEGRGWWLGLAELLGHLRAPHGQESHCHGTSGSALPLDWPLPSWFDTAGTGRAARTAFHTLWPSVIPLEPQSCPGAEQGSSSPCGSAPLQSPSRLQWDRGEGSRDQGLPWPGAAPASCSALCLLPVTH